MKFTSWRLAAVMVLVAAGGCRSTLPVEREAGESIVNASGPEAAREEAGRPADSAARDAETTGAGPGAGPDAGSLDLATAIELADQHHPEIAAAQAYLRAASGRVTQAGTWVNPRLDAAMEGAPFNGRTTGDAELLVGVIQTLPVGGRLDAATTAAQAEEKRRSFEALATRRRVHGAVRRSFFTVLYTARLVAAERELLETAEALVGIARVRVSAGEGIPEEVSRAELEAEGMRLRLRESEAALEEARLALAESMGRPEMTVGSVDGDLYESLEAPALEDLLERIGDHPELLVAAARLEESEARLQLAEVRRIPDVDVGVGYRQLGGSDTDAFDVRFGLPLPFFSRNEGAIAEARANVEAARAEERSRRTELETSARVLYHRLSRALRAVRIYSEELVPRAETVLESAEARYRAGDASLAELLPMRRDAARLKLEALDAVRELTQRWSELKGLAPEE